MSCCCHRHCCCSCCSCGCSDEDQDLGGVSLTEFPVYVSYPAFFAGDDAIDGANQAIFGLNGTTTRVLTRGASRSGSCRG